MINDFLPLYALCIAFILFVGETLILIRTDKYYPLSLDDYFACALLSYSAFTLDANISKILMLCCWCFMSGNLYAMLFTRMDPKTGTRERLAVLSALLCASILGAGATFYLISQGIA